MSFSADVRSRFQFDQHIRFCHHHRIVVILKCGTKSHLSIVLFLCLYISIFCCDCMTAVSNGSQQIIKTHRERNKMTLRAKAADTISKERQDVIEVQ